jgi:tetratricopeptide (TPR) repeat protein/protocatechuate 3,4-dioxygenase beta subunit
VGSDAYANIVGFNAIRGGAWAGDARDCRSARRFEPGLRLHDLGLRVSREFDGQKGDSPPAKEASGDARAKEVPTAAPKQAPETPLSELPLDVSGRVVDDATGRPIAQFLVQDGIAGATTIEWYFDESRTNSPNPEGRFDERIKLGYGWRKRIVAVGYLPQPLPDKAPAAGVKQIKDQVVRLKRSGEISGQVLYHDGSPAADVPVFFLLGERMVLITAGKAWQGGRMEPAEDRAVTRTTTDSAGRFRLPGGGGNANIIAVSGPRLDFWAVPAPAADAKNADLTITLPQPGRLVVHYDVAGGDAQAKLRLHLYARAGPQPRGVFNYREPTVANRGQVVLDNLPPGYYDLSRQKLDPSDAARGGFRCDLRTVIIESGKTATSDFVSERGTPVQGRIAGLKEGMFADNMKPGALVTVGPPEATAEMWAACKGHIGIRDGLRCGLDGKFQTERLSPGKYAVIAEAYVAETPEERGATRERKPAFIGRAEVTVPEDGPPPQVTVELRPRDTTGEIRHGGKREKQPAEVRTGRGNAATPAKPPPGELAGTVTDAAGKPLAGVLVKVWTWCPGDKTTTDEQGRFMLKNLGSEPVEIRFSKEGFGPWYSSDQPTGVEMHVTLSDKTYFEGDVRGPDGKPLSNALIRADCGPKRNPQVLIESVWTETRSDQNGHYRLYVMPDKYVIHVRVPKVGVARLSQTLIGDGETKKLDISLAPGATFRATAVDSQSGAPIPNVRLSNWRHKGIEGSSDKDGKIVIDGMAPGNFTFDVTARGYARWWSPQAVEKDQKKDLSRTLQRNFDYLEFDLTDNMAPLRIELEREVRISGVVRDPDGNPVAGATAAPAHTGTGNSLTGDTRFSVVTAKDGTFVMTLPASGNAKCNLEAHDGTYQQWRKWANGVLDPIQTRPGDELKNVVIKLTRPATVRGHVKDESGKPLVDREVRASAADKLENRYYDPTTTTDKEGNFELRFIRPGDHFIQAAPFWATEVPAGQNLLRVPVKNSFRVTLKEGETKAGVELETPASTRFPSVEEQVRRAIEEQIRRETEKAATQADTEAKSLRDELDVGERLAAAGKFDEAMTHYSKLLADHPHDADVQNGFGTVLLRMGRKEEAAAHFREAIAINPNHADAKKNLDRAMERGVPIGLMPDAEGWGAAGTDGLRIRLVIPAKEGQKPQLTVESFKAAIEVWNTGEKPVLVAEQNFWGGHEQSLDDWMIGLRISVRDKDRTVREFFRADDYWSKLENSANTREIRPGEKARYGIRLDPVVDKQGVNILSLRGDYELQPNLLVRGQHPVGWRGDASGGWVPVTLGNAVQTPQSQAFGPVIERVVRDAIDFDTGRLAKLPLTQRTDNPGEDKKVLLRTLEQQGIDAWCASGPLCYIGSKSKSLTNEEWDHLTPAQLLARLASTGGNALPEVEMGAGDHPPATYAF